MIRETLAAVFRLVRSPIAAFDDLLARRPHPVVQRIVLLGLAPLVAVYLAAQYPTVSKYVLVAIAPPVVLLSWVIQAAVLTATARLLGGRTSFQLNLLIYGYAQVPHLFALLVLPFPVIIPFVAVCTNSWSILLLYLGLARAHGLSRWRTLVILLTSQVFIPLGLFLLFLLLVGSAGLPA